MNRLGPVLLIAATAALFTSLGCYTIVRHPDDPLQASDWEDRLCMDCHADSDQYHPVGYDPPGYRYSDPWYGWYERPWWWDGWHAPHGPGPGPGTQDSLADYSRGRNAWERGPGSPAPTPGVDGRTTPVQPGPSGPAVHTPSDTTRTHPPAPTVKPPVKVERRNGWRR